jgi:cytochrome c-type biogenesis protein CcmH
MKKLFFIFTFCLVMFSQSAFSSQEREVEIYKNIRCLVCQGQSLNDSNSDFANDLKKNY